MPTPFDDWTLEDARVAVQLSTDDSKRLGEYRAAVAGDLWQNWAWWTGPIPDSADEDYTILSAGIVRGFVSRNVLSEGVGRHVNGVLGRDVKWEPVVRRKLKEGDTPTTDEQALIDEAKDLLTEWVEARKLNQEYDKLGEHLLVDGAAYQRPFVPPGEIDANGMVPPADIATNLGRVYVHLPQKGEAVIYTDPRTQRKCSVYLYREQTSSRPSQAQNQQGDERAELTYLDGGQTVVRIIGKDGDIVTADNGLLTGDAENSGQQSLVSSQQSDYRYPLGNRLLMADMQRKPLLNEQVASQQKFLNKTLSHMARNGDMGGFRERVTYNARMGGVLVTAEDGTQTFVATPLPKGAGAQTNLTGYPLTAADGSQSITTPGMDWIDPVPVDTFLEAATSAYHAILAEMNQLHYAAAGSSGISAESRLIAQSAYLIDLLHTKQQIDAGWAWLLETALALAAVLSGEAGKFDSLRISAECSVDPGPISVEMMNTTMALVGGQPLLSVKTGRSWIGVEDVDAEQQQIAKEQEERLERQVTEATEMAKTVPQDVRGNGAGGSSSNGDGNGAGMPAAQNGRAA